MSENTSRRFTKWLGALMLMIVAIAVTACGDDESSGAAEDSGSATTAADSAAAAPAAAGGEVKKGLKLAYFSVGSNNTYLQAGIKGAEETAEKYGASIDVLDGEFDGGKQLNQMMNAIGSKKYDGFILEPNNSQQLCSAVKAAIDAKIAIGITNVPACDAAYDSVYEGTAIFVGGQSEGVYEQWFKQGLDAAGEGEYAVMNGPATQGNTVRARKVLDERIKSAYPGWKEVGFEYTDYQSSIALAKTQTLLSKSPNVTAIFSSYAGHTPGIISAIKAAGKSDQVKVYDLGGDKTMFAALEKGDIASTEVYLPYEEAQRGVQAVVAQLSDMAELDGVKVGEFWDLTTDPRLKGLDAFVTKDSIAKYEAIELPEY